MKIEISPDGIARSLKKHIFKIAFTVSFYTLYQLWWMQYNLPDSGTREPTSKGMLVGSTIVVFTIISFVLGIFTIQEIKDA